MRRLALAVFFFPVAAIAQQAAPQPPQLSFETIVAGLFSLLILVAPRVVQLLDERNRSRLALLAKWTQVAFHATDEAARLTPNSIDDKVAFALGKLAALLEAAGAKPLSDDEKELAKAEFSALNVIEKKAQALAPASPP